jgi:hypothetical protein
MLVLRIRHIFCRLSARDHIKAELNEECSKKKVLKDEHKELKKKHCTLLTRGARKSKF